MWTGTPLSVSLPGLLNEFRWWFPSDTLGLGPETLDPEQKKRRRQWVRVIYGTRYRVRSHETPVQVKQLGTPP